MLKRQMNRSTLHDDLVSTPLLFIDFSMGSRCERLWVQPLVLGSFAPANPIFAPNWEKLGFNPFIKTIVYGVK